MRTKMIFGIMIVTIVIMIFSGFVPTFGDYSDGERSGILQKFSHKGIIFKTYEGEMAMEGIKFNTENSDGSVFEFSVTDEGVARQLDTLVGKRITVNYQQKYHVSSYDGATDYLITSVRVNR